MATSKRTMVVHQHADITRTLPQRELSARKRRDRTTLPQPGIVPQPNGSTATVKTAQ